MSSPSFRNNPSSAAAIAGKYEFEIMSGTASFMAMPCVGGSIAGVLVAIHVRCANWPVPYTLSASSGRQRAAGFTPRAGAGKGRRRQCGEPHQRQHAAKSIQAEYNPAAGDAHGAAE